MVRMNLLEEWPDLSRHGAYQFMRLCSSPSFVMVRRPAITLNTMRPKQPGPDLPNQPVQF